MLIPAMIFAGMTFIVGIILGYLLGAARVRMSAEEQLGEAEKARASLEAKISELRAQFEALRTTLQSSSSAPPSTGHQP